MTVTFVLVNHFHLHIVSSMSLGHVKRDQVLLRARSLLSGRIVRSEDRACLTSLSRTLSQRARSMESSGAKCASRDNNSNVHIISQQKNGEE